MFAVPSNRNKSNQNITIVVIRWLFVLFFISAWFDNLYNPNRYFISYIVYCLSVKRKVILQTEMNKCYFFQVQKDKTQKMRLAKEEFCKKEPQGVMYHTVFRFRILQGHVNRERLLNKRNDIWLNVSRIGLDEYNDIN